MEYKIISAAVLLAASVAALEVAAFPEIPKDSARELGVTRTRAFNSGAVFINGKYIEPPYVVERWGTGIRINGQQVMGQVIEWNEFLKTQEGVKVTKTEVAAPVVEAPSVPSVEDSYDSSLDDLFDDNPKPAKKRPTFLSPPSTRPKVSTIYSLDGKFESNEATKKLLEKINTTRAEIDRILRTGGFICFGDSYSRVTGDARTLMTMLESLPKLQQNASDLNAFRAGVRSSRLVYLNEVLCADLFANRTDYRKLNSLRSKLEKSLKMQRMLDDISSPIL